MRGDACPRQLGIKRNIRLNRPTNEHSLFAKQEQRKFDIKDCDIGLRYENF